MTIQQCWICGDCGEGYVKTPTGAECPGCFKDAAGFDADELGLDPETDNTPNDQGRQG